jgi:predicted nucleic acid-binding protein
MFLDCWGVSLPQSCGLIPSCRLHPTAKAVGFRLALSINLKEIAVGKMIVEDPTPTVEDVLADFAWLEVEPFGEGDAVEAARIEADLRESEEYTPNLAADVLIAGVARRLEAPVVTKNVSDFEKLGVETVGY